MRIRRIIGALALVAACAGCATYKPSDIRQGQSVADVEQLMGMSTGQYTMPSGNTRLEFATGPQGRFTWMVDLDAQGRVLRVDQVLDEKHFAQVQLNFEKMDAKDLRRTLGRPGDVRGGGWQGGQVWSWRYPTNECFWFQVSILDSGKLRDGGTYGIDPQCDPGNRGRW